MHFTITGSLSFLASSIEKVEIETYMSYDSNPDYKDMNLLSNFKGGKERIEFSKDSMIYRFSVRDNTIGKDQRHMATYPFFKHEKYYIFMYVRFKIKDSGYMPAESNEMPLYIRCRYELQGEEISRKSYYYKNHQMVHSANTVEPMPEGRNAVKVRGHYQ